MSEQSGWPRINWNKANAELANKPFEDLFSDPPKAALNSSLARIRKVTVKLPNGKTKVIEKVKGFQI